MTVDIVDELHKNKHERLQHYAMIANVFTWLIAIYYAIWAFGFLPSDWIWYIRTRGLPDEIAKNILEVLSYDPVIVFLVLVKFLKTILTGAVLALILKGISHGLHMLIKIDLNQKLLLQGVSDEK
jgi:hypothetical protein